MVRRVIFIAVLSFFMLFVSFSTSHQVGAEEKTAWSKEQVKNRRSATFPNAQNLRLGDAENALDGISLHPHPIAFHADNSLAVLVREMAGVGTLLKAFRDDGMSKAKTREGEMVEAGAAATG